MKDTLSEEQVTDLLSILQLRFEKNINRHPGLKWSIVKERLLLAPSKIRSIYAMEFTGGEPDVIYNEDIPDEIIFFDCVAESPKGRRSLCYDRQAWESRKEHKPENTVIDMVEDMGVTLMTEEQYRSLQSLGAFDTKTSSWVFTPEKIRRLGGAIFCDRRYDTVFLYHNGAESYYAARGFRAVLKV